MISAAQRSAGNRCGAAIAVQSRTLKIAGQIPEAAACHRPSCSKSGSNGRAHVG
jgi:hypothetical protein